MATVLLGSQSGEALEKRSIADKGSKSIFQSFDGLKFDRYAGLMSDY